MREEALLVMSVKFASYPIKVFIKPTCNYKLIL